MDVSLPALRMDSARLQARGAFCWERCRVDGSFVCKDVPRTTQAALYVQLIRAIIRHSESHSRVGRSAATQPCEEARDRYAS